MNDDEVVDRTRENIKEDIQTSAKASLGLHELKQNKPWFDEECLGFLDQRKQAKMQWIQDPSKNNVDNLNKVRREVSRHFRNKKKAYMRAKIEDLETDSKIKNIGDLYRGISDFKKGYQPSRTHDPSSDCQDHHPPKNSVQKTICCNSTSNAPDDGRMYQKHVELRIHQ